MRTEVRLCKGYPGRMWALAGQGQLGSLNEYLFQFLGPAIEHYHRWVAKSYRNIFSQFQKFPEI